jgi:predicted TIM-barrel fold metal-dependent hydrolase
LVNKYPTRFAGFAAIAYQSPNAAAVELERAVTVLGLKGGIVFLPRINNTPISDFDKEKIFHVSVENLLRL